MVEASYEIWIYWRMMGGLCRRKKSDDEMIDTKLIISISLLFHMNCSALDVDEA